MLFRSIEPTKAAKLFQPFSQIDSALDRAHEGTGLGLALVRRLAEVHGGGVGMTSTPGHGTEFWVDLPASQPVGTEPTPPSPEASTATRPVVLLAVRPSPAGQRLQEAFAHLGYQSVTCHTGPEALDTARLRRYALIVVDPQVAHLGEVKLIQRLSQHAGPTPIVVLDSVDTNSQHRRYAEAGAAAIVHPPVSTPWLRSLLLRLALPVPA